MIDRYGTELRVGDSVVFSKYNDTRFYVGKITEISKGVLISESQSGARYARKSNEVFNVAALMSKYPEVFI